MNGLFGSYHIEVLENGLRVTALDGKRISICSAGEGKVQYDFVVAGEFLKEAIALSDGKAYMETDGQSILVSGEGVEVFAKTRAESYPNIKNILNDRKSLTTMTVNRQEFLDAILVSTLLDKTVILDITEHGATLSNKPSIKGDSFIELSALIKGPSIRIGLNGSYLKDSLQVLKNDDITLHFSHAKAPVFIEEEHQMELILPVQIQSNYSSREHVR